VTGRSIKHALEDVEIPDEHAAQARGWDLVRRDFTARTPERARRRPLARPALAGLATAAIVVTALTPPGDAVADWVRDVVTRESGTPNASPRLRSLPSPGRLLVASAEGPWIVAADGSKRLLGPYRGASWSPHGLFLAAWRGAELRAVDPLGQVRWSVSAPASVRAARWSADGFRIAYLSGRTLRLVVGNGTGDHLLRREVADVAPAWRPGPGHLVALADRDGRVSLVEADTGGRRWRSEPADVPSQLEWSPDGRHLVVLSRRVARVFSARGALLDSVSMPPGTTAVTMAFDGRGRRLALIRADAARGRSEVVTFPGATGLSHARRVFSGPGRLSDLAFSPDRRWLLVGWRDADQWLFLRLGRDAVSGVADITAQFAARGRPDAVPFPRVLGWCCATRR
jgi:hypothetical protein